MLTPDRIEQAILTAFSVATAGAGLVLLVLAVAALAYREPIDFGDEQ